MALETLDPEGRLAVRDRRALAHLARGRPQMLRHLDAVIDAVHRPDVRCEDPRPHRERFCRRDLSPDRWWRVVVDLGEVPAGAGADPGAPEGHAIDFDAQGEIVGMVLLDVRWTLDSEGAITLSCPADRLEADRLAPALAAAA